MSGVLDTVRQGDDECSAKFAAASHVIWIEVSSAFSF